MRKIDEEPRIYKHELLMQDLNEMSIRIKIWLCDEPPLSKLQESGRYPKPTTEEIDHLLLRRVYRILEEDSKPMKVK